MSSEYIPSMRAKSFWNEENTQRLKDLWPKGLTCLQIGKILGTTRNSVSGRAHRLDLPKHPQPRLAPGTIKRKRDRDLAALRGEIFQKPERIVNIDPDVKLGKENCKWVLDLRPTIYCAEPAILNKSYCPHHHAIAVKADPPRRDRQQARNLLLRAFY